MGARLRVVLDQLVHVVDADHASAAVDLAAGLVATAPSGCFVDAIVPAGADLFEVKTRLGLDDGRRLKAADQN